MPKPLREALRLEGGTILEIREHEGRIELEPVPVPMRLVRRGKGLVATTDEPLPQIGAGEVRAILESLRRGSPSTARSPSRPSASGTS